MNRVAEKYGAIEALRQNLQKCINRSRLLRIARVRRLLLMLILPVLLLCNTTPSNTSSGVNVSELFYQSKESGTYVPPELEELGIAESLFSRMLEGERGEQLKVEWQRLGFRLQELNFKGKMVLALFEADNERRGRGFYLFPIKPVGASVLMMPHRFFDMHTGPIGLKLFQSGLFSAAAWNTVHRYKNSKKKNGFQGINNSLPNWDLADLERSYFTALTRAFTRTFPTGHLVQVHGFSQEKRTSWAGRDSDLILSNGTQHPPEDLISLSDCLKLQLGVMVRVYPLEIRDLGAMENVSARICNDFGNRGFIQMEMSYPLRQKLLKSEEQAKVITNCMQESWH